MLFKATTRCLRPLSPLNQYIGWYINGHKLLHMFIVYSYSKGVTKMNPTLLHLAQLPDWCARIALDMCTVCGDIESLEFWFMEFLRKEPTPLEYHSLGSKMSSTRPERFQHRIFYLHKPLQRSPCLEVQAQCRSPLRQSLEPRSNIRHWC